MSFLKVVCLSETRICRNLRNVYIDSGIKFNVVKHIIAFCTAYPRTSLSWNCCLLQLVCLERNMCKVDFSFCATDVSVAWSSWNPACLYGCSSVVSIHWQLHDTARCSLAVVWYGVVQATACIEPVKLMLKSTPPYLLQALATRRLPICCVSSQ